MKGGSGSDFPDPSQKCECSPTKGGNSIWKMIIKV